MTTPVATEPGPPPATTSDGRPRRSPRRVAVISLFTTADVVRRSLSTVVERRGITLQQYNVLRILRGGEEDGLPTLTIAERMIEQTPGITRLLDRIEKHGPGSKISRLDVFRLTQQLKRALDRRLPAVPAAPEGPRGTRLEES